VTPSHSPSVLPFLPSSLFLFPKKKKKEILPLSGIETRKELVLRFCQGILSVLLEWQVRFLVLLHVFLFFFFPFIPPKRALTVAQNGARDSFCHCMGPCEWNRIEEISKNEPDSSKKIGSCFLESCPMKLEVNIVASSQEWILLLSFSPSPAATLAGVTMKESSYFTVKILKKFTNK